MASYQKRKTGVTAWVRIKPFNPVSKTLPTKAEAKEWAEKLEGTLRAQRKQRATAPNLGKYTIAQLSNDYLADPAIQSLKYCSELQTYLAWWVNHFGSTRIHDVGPLLLREARSRLQPGRGPRTVNGYLAALRSAWNWGQSASLVPQDHAWPKRLMLKVPKARTRFLNDVELSAVLDACAADPVMNAAIRLSISSGLRKSELLKLKWSDIDLAGEQSVHGPRLLVPLPKNEEPRSIHLPSSAIAALEALKELSVVGTRVFINPDGEPLTVGQLDWRWKTIRKTAKLEDFRWHDQRHTTASYLAQGGANLLEIGTVLGHKNVEVTKKYSHLIQGAPVTGHSKLDEKLRGGK